MRLPHSLPVLPALGLSLLSLLALPSCKSGPSERARLQTHAEKLFLKQELAGGGSGCELGGLKQWVTPPGKDRKDAVSYQLGMEIGVGAGAKTQPPAGNGAALALTYTCGTFGGKGRECRLVTWTFGDHFAHDSNPDAAYVHIEGKYLGSCYGPLAKWDTALRERLATEPDLFRVPM